MAWPTSSSAATSIIRCTMPAAAGAPRGRHPDSRAVRRGQRERVGDGPQLRGRGRDDGVGHDVRLHRRAGRAPRTVIIAGVDSGFDTMQLPDAPDAVAPDGSDVRVLLRLGGGSMAHFELGAGRVSRALLRHPAGLLPAGLLPAGHQASPQMAHHGFRPTPHIPGTSPGPGKEVASGRQWVSSTTPGSTSSRPSKNPVICSGLRRW
jgi:hypothetical protein